MLRIIDDVIEFDGWPVARLLPRTPPTVLHRFAMWLDDADDIDVDDDELRELLRQYLAEGDLLKKLKPKPKPKLTLIEGGAAS